jgi:hypothetical protein
MWHFQDQARQLLDSLGYSAANNWGFGAGTPSVHGAVTQPGGVGNLYQQLDRMRSAAEAQKTSITPGPMPTAAPVTPQALPSWMQVPTDASQMGFADVPDWTKPFSPEELAIMRQAGALDVNKTASDLSAQNLKSLSQRGISNSSGGVSLSPMVELYRRTQLAKNNADILGASKTRSDALRAETNQQALTKAGINQNLRGESAQNFQTLYNLASGQTPSGQIGQYTGTLSGLAGSAQDRANAWGQIAQQANAAGWGTIGTVAGAFIGKK